MGLDKLLDLGKKAGNANLLDAIIDKKKIKRKMIKIKMNYLQKF